MSRINKNILNKILEVGVSRQTYEKTSILNKMIRFSEAHNAWGKNQKILKTNLMLASSTKNYRVLLALKSSKNR